MPRLKGLYILDQATFDMVYGPDERADIARLVEVDPVPKTAASVAANPQILSSVDVIFSGWGAPVLDQEFLDAAPKLKAFFYGGGAMGSVLTHAMWDRGVVVTSAIAANAVPVAEYTP